LCVSDFEVYRATRGLLCYAWFTVLRVVYHAMCGLPRYAWFTNNLGTILPLFSGTFNLVLDFYSLRSKNQYNLGASSGHNFYVAKELLEIST